MHCSAFIIAFRAYSSPKLTREYIESSAIGFTEKDVSDIKQLLQTIKCNSPFRTGVNLTRCDLSNIFLENANLSSARLDNANLTSGSCWC